MSFDRRARWSWPAIAALLLAVGPSHRSEAVQLEVTGPVPCDLRRRLGALLDSQGAAGSSAQLEIAQLPAGDLEVKLRDRGGRVLFQREVETARSSCDSIESSVTLLASMWLRTLPRETASNRRTARHQPVASEGGGVTVEADSGAVPDAGTTQDAGVGDAAMNDAGSGADAGAGLSDAGPEAPDAGPPRRMPVVPAAPAVAPPPPIFGDTGFAVGALASTSVGIDGLWIPTWLGGTAELILPELRIRAVLAQGRTLSEQSAPGELAADDLFASLRVARPLGSLGFAAEAGLRLDKVDVSTSGFGSDQSATLWDPGLELGARWRHGIGPACWVDAGLMVSARAHRRVLQVEGVGPLLTLPAFWLAPELLGGCRIF